MRLRVCPTDKEDVYRDIARVPDAFRKTKNGRQIKEGKFCKISVGTNSTYLILRGKGNLNENVIFLDEISREKLGVEKGEEAEFTIEPVGYWGGLRWALGASDLAYRIAAWLAAISAALGFIALILGILSLSLS